MNLYNLKMLTPDTFTLAKFDSDFNVVAIYNLAPKGHSYTCDCPANQRSVVTKPCKHKRFLPFMLGAVNTDRFYEPESGTWHQPLGDLHREPPSEIEAQPEDAGEALGSSTELVQGANRTATQADEDARKAYEPVQRAAEAILEPIVNRVHELITKHGLTQPAPTIRRR